MKPLIQKKGDAIKALQAGDIDYLMHCVNCQGVMGGGIASQIKANYPKVFKGYKAFCDIVDKRSRLLGHVLILDKIINLFAQDDFGVHERQLHYGALAKCIANLPNEIPLETEKQQIYIGVPRLMCCGLAGGKWEVVSEMLESLPHWVQIVVYDFN